MAVKLNDQSEISIPLRNLIALVAAATVSTYAYFGIIENI